MRVMMDLGNNQRGPLHIIDTATSVDCTKDVRFRRSFRSLIECMIRCCGFPPSFDDADTDYSTGGATAETCSGGAYTAATLTGTFFGFRRGRVSFCLHDDASRTWPILLLELSVPTAYLAKEMQHGLLRIALESERGRGRSSSSLFSVPVWSMYCNGRKVGFAVRRRISQADAAVFKLMRSVSVGAAVIPGHSSKSAGADVDGDLMYLRASFQRVIGSVDSESFHMINPVGSSGQQQLSIFLLRS